MCRPVLTRCHITEDRHGFNFPNSGAPNEPVWLAIIGCLTRCRLRSGQRVTVLRALIPKSGVLAFHLPEAYPLSP